MKRKLRVAVIAGAALASTACNRKPSVDVTPVNALVPAKYQYKLRFEPREVSSGLRRHVRYTVPVPAAWKSDDVGISEPTDKVIYGNSSIFVHSSCDAESCVMADWNAMIDEELRLLHVERDERGDHRRVVVARPWISDDFKGFVVKVYWWKDGASEYHACEASVDVALNDAADAFEKACELAIVHDD